MIEKIDIVKFGSYSNFKHDKNIDSKYRKLNICYGKNYSGKSTFSKIFQSFETKELPDKYSDVEFSIMLDSQVTLTENDVDKDDIKIKVFNSNYIRKNLDFFGENGMNSFALLGSENLKIETEINKLVEENKALDSKIATANEKYQGMKIKLNQVKDTFEKSKTALAREIRQDNNLFIGNYDKRNLEREISKAIEASYLDDMNKKALRLSIIEEEKDLQSKQIFPNNEFAELLQDSNYLLRKVIKPSVVIEELENDSKKQRWVQDGILLHKSGDSMDSNCKFCGSLITQNRYDILDQFFSKELSNFERELKDFLTRLDFIKNSINQVELLKKEKFYVKYHSNVDSLNQMIQFERGTEISFLDNLIHAINQKINSIYLSIEELDIAIPQGFYNDKENINDMYNSLYEENKNLSDQLDNNKKSSREALRMNFIKFSLDKIKYPQIQEELKILETEYVLRKEEFDENYRLHKINSSKIEEYKAQLSNEKIAATEINKYLNNDLGHDELYLDVSDSLDKQSSFVVLRQGDTAHNLSEGEMSLIAFAYFLATLKEISENKRADTIIFIDDPISSLDENNIFYIFSLIQSEVINKNYGQVFITTHNLDFFKYATKYSTKIMDSRGNNKMFLMIDKMRDSEGNWVSKVCNMPKYMSSKVTEFNFLFEQIYIVARKQQNDSNYHVFYNFPNNARKFLETLLFFKYPSYKNKDNNSAWKLMDFFGEGVNESFINRINNEYSHGEDRFDRLTKQINSAEFCKDANLILKTIKDKDLQQYQSLLDNSDLSDF
ncbi:AAA family ATPase [Listeria rocourtiae]|uniref:AAA family ATPase n=1 Tax=Listeria rocourtiae TaxID=647910 RepID=UPI001629A3D2|nr:AAA family ATPase [Listeria rocourtiae]MBC1604097.1 AAA family ATPase [Listeria rocourtiae]